MMRQQHSETGQETNEVSRDDQIIQDMREGSLTTRQLMKKWHKNPNQLKDLRQRAENKVAPSPSTPAKIDITSDGEVAAACFAIFDKEDGPVEAVKQLKIPP